MSDIALNQEVEQGVYEACHIQQALGLGRSKTYEYLQKVYRTQEPFRVIKIGKLFRIPKYSFDRWLYEDSLSEVKQLSGKKSGVAFFEDSSWYHRIKLLQDDGTTVYRKRGGFESKEQV